MLRAKHAREIRAGITKAQFEVRFTIEMGRPPFASPGSLDTELARKAYNRTVARMVVSEIVAVGERMVKKVNEKWPETVVDGA